MCAHVSLPCMGNGKYILLLIKNGKQHMNHFLLLLNSLSLSVGTKGPLEIATCEKQGNNERTFCYLINQYFYTGVVQEQLGLYHTSGISVSCSKPSAASTVGMVLL